MAGELVALAGGLTVPEPAYVFTFALLNRGLDLKAEGDKLRVIGPAGAKPELSPADVEQIHRWKFHILALLAYRAPES